MRLYAFRTTHNLMNGTVFVARWKWAAKRWIKCDLYPNWLDLIVGLFIIEIGADGYLAESHKSIYPNPGQIVEYEYER